LPFKETNTSYDVACKLEMNTRRPVSQLEYASAIGMLMHTIHCTRLGTAFGVCKLSRYTSNPSIEHWKAIGEVLGYLKRTKDIALHHNDFPSVLQCYSEASCITSLGENKSTSS